MRTVFKFASIAAAAAIIMAPTAAAASTAPSSGNAWATLSQLNPAGATALAGSAGVGAAPIAASAAAAQPAEDGDYHSDPFPWPVAVVLLGVVATAIYIAFIEKHHGHATFPNPNSPS